MTIPEAVKLILESSCLAKNNEIYFLDMGKSHNIYELAKKMIRLNGLKPKIKDDKGDIKIIFTGLKNGEKIYEELSYSKPENFSINKNILIDSYNFGNSKETLNNLEKLINYIENENYEEILEFSKKIKKLIKNEIKFFKLSKFSFICFYILPLALISGPLISEILIALIGIYGVIQFSKNKQAIQSIQKYINILLIFYLVLIISSLISYNLFINKLEIFAYLRFILFVIGGFFY